MQLPTPEEILKQLRPWLMVALISLTGCASPNAPAPSKIEKAQDGSFSITQAVRAGVGTRSDFDAGVRFLEQEEYENAVSRLLEAAESAPQIAAVHINLGLAYGGLEKWDLAETSLRRAVELSPRHPVAHNELGIALRHQGLFEDAQKSYDRALDIAPDFHFARRNLAILCDLFLEDARCALDNYERYSQAVPDDKNVAIWMGDLRNRVER